MLTLSWNRPLALRRARADLRALHARVDERFYGRRFFRRRPADRTLAVFVFEKCDTHMHVHSLWRVPDRSKLLPFHRMFTGERGGIWNDVVPSGSYALSIIGDHGTAGGYIMKDQHMTSDDSLMVWSDEFLTSRAT